MFPKLEGEIAPYMTFNGKKVLAWTFNNYLGLANDPEVRKADAEAAAKWGLAYPMGARMMSGHTSLHEQLERELAEFECKEDAYLFNFGYQGMISTIDALVTRHDVIVYDSEAHACIMDGVRLHMGKRIVYPHNDIERCEKALQRATRLTQESGGGILLITEGVYGMTGGLGRLDLICNKPSAFIYISNFYSSVSSTDSSTVSSTVSSSNSASFSTSASSVNKPSVFTSYLFAQKEQRRVRPAAIASSTVPTVNSSELVNA